MSFTTQPKAGAPTTINIGPSLIEAMMTGTPLSWVLPIWGLIQTVEIDTADLCSSVPGYPESWGVTDLLASLDASQVDVVRAKLLRMARANVWGTYCEFAPLAGPQLPALVASDAVQRNIVAPIFFPDQFSQTIDGVDFWALYTRCNVASPNGAVPYLKGGTYTDATDPKLGIFTNTVGEELVTVIAVGSTWPNPGGGGGVVEWTPSGTWRVRCEAESGSWSYSVTAWNLDGRPTAPLPQPWAPAPADPVPYQFTDPEADAIVLMSSEWTAHRIAGSLHGGQLAEIESLSQDILLLLADEGPLTAVSGSAITTGGNILSIPAGARGAVVTISIPSRIATMGSSPGISWDVGYACQGTPYAWYPSVRLKHTPQLIHPFETGVTKLGIDLSPNCSGMVDWLMPG